MPKGADPCVDSRTIQLLKPQHLKGFLHKTVVVSPVTSALQAQDTELALLAQAIRLLSELEEL